MSDAMYPTRLRWHHTMGCARHDGVSVELTRAPDLPGMQHMTELDYIPHVIAVVRIGCEPTRDMTQAERTDAMTLLQQMASDARDALDGDSTLVISGFGKL